MGDISTHGREINRAVRPTYIFCLKFRGWAYIVLDMNAISRAANRGIAGKIGNIAVASVGLFLSGLWIGMMIADPRHPWHAYLQFLFFGGLYGVAVFFFVIVPSYVKDRNPVEPYSGD